MLQNHFCKSHATFTYINLGLELSLLKCFKIHVRDDLVFCLVIMFMIEVIYPDKNNKNVIANYHFNIMQVNF